MPDLQEITNRVTHIEALMESVITYKWGGGILAGVIGTAVAVFLFFSDIQIDGAKNEVLLKIEPRLAVIESRLAGVDQKLEQFQETQKEQGKQLDDISGTLQQMNIKLEGLAISVAEVKGDLATKKAK